MIKNKLVVMVINLEHRKKVYQGLKLKKK